VNRSYHPPQASLVLRPDRWEKDWAEARPRASAYLAGRGVRGDDLEDLLQETAIRLLRHPPQGIPFLVAALSAARLCLIKHWKTRRPSDELPEDLSSPSSEEDLILASDLDAALATLDPRLAALALLFLEGWTHREAAEILDVSPRTITHMAATLEASSAIRKTLKSPG
jgi:DNA-directed RNA polymerase specialized sigma24 family protein